MAIYVDQAVYKKPGGRKVYAHLVASTFEELHSFAQSISVKPHFFHKSAKYQHYDITAEQREFALSAGAEAVSSQDIIKFSKIMMETPCSS
jgi:hypothetical protein